MKSILNETKPVAGAHGRLVRPLDMHLTDEQEREEKAVDFKPSAEQKRIIAALATSPTAATRGSDLAERLGIEMSAFAKDIKALSEAGLVIGLRGKGWRLPGSMPEKRGALDYTLASRIEKIITSGMKEQTTQKLAAQLAEPLAKVVSAVAYLKREGVIHAKRGGWLEPGEGQRGVPPLARAKRTDEEPELLPQKKRGNGVHRDEEQQPRAPLPALLEDNPEGACYAIDEHGRIGVKKQGGSVMLDREELERLQAFMSKTKPLWKETEE